MFILFSLIVMRTSGAVLFNPILGRSNVPSSVKAAFIFALSLLMYIGAGGTLLHEPGGMLEYGFMLVKELFVGFVIGYTMELAAMIVRFASAIMDFVMGLSMAQVYDPQSGSQVTVTSGLYYAFLILLFFSVDGHVLLIEIFYKSAEAVPYGGVIMQPGLAQAVLELFSRCIELGLRFAFPLLAMELVTEFAIGILMRIIPQINVFVVNFQLKIIIGLLMLLMLFGPMSDNLYRIIEWMFQWIEELLPFLREGG